MSASKMTLHEIPAIFKFPGVFKVHAPGEGCTHEEAVKRVRDHCALAMGQDLQTTDDRIDWEFDVHATLELPLEDSASESHITEEELPHVLLVGDVINGIEVIGPFDDLDAACAWGNEDPHLENSDWHPAPVRSPENV